MYSVPSSYRLVLGSWSTLAEPAKHVRFTVFVDEQNVPAEMEPDEWDDDSVHAVVFDAQDHAVATGRLLPDGHIGRIAVMSASRGCGLGGLILQALINEGRRRAYPALMLSAQTHAIGFYEKYRFFAEGEVYPDAGIDHQDMRLILTP